MNPKKSLRSKQPLWRSKWLWVVVILLLAGGGGGYYTWTKMTASTANAAALTASEARTSAVTKGDLVVSASGSGNLVASQSVDLSFSTRGTLVELDVKIGDLVTKGQTLARLGTTADLDAALAAAELQVLTAQNSLDTLQSNAQVALANAYQATITAQATFDSAATADARTAYARCSQEVMNRYKETLDQITETLADLTQRDKGSQQWINASNDYDTASANYSYCLSYTADEKAVAKSSLEVASSNLKQAQTTYNTLKAGAGIDPNALALAEANLKTAQTKLNSAQENLAGTALTAPIAGKVIYLAAGEGAIVDTAKFITIVAIDQPTVSVSVDEADMDKLALGNSAEITFDALPEEVFSGKVVQVDPQLTVSGQYRVAKGLIRLDSSAAETIQALPLGLSATITVISQEAKNVLLAPVTALKSLGDQQYAVMVKGSDGILKLRIVTIGIQDSTSVEIVSGLNEGDLVSTGTVQASGSNSSTKASNEFTGDMMPPMDGGGAPPAP
jgi:multidrug efflux pump subunit AcrA (membrane-fusion protein)